MNRPRLDGAILAAATIASYGLAVWVGLFERFTQWTRPFGRWNLDELGVPLLVFAVGSAWYANRRRKELRQEIHARAEAEQALRDSEQRYRTLIETVPHGIEEIDVSGIITVANPAHHKQYEYGEGELIGMSILDLAATASDREELRDHLKYWLKAQSRPVPYFGRKRTKNGRVIDVQVDWNYKRDIQGQVTGFIAVVTDITERKRAEQAVRQSEQRYRTLFELAPSGVLVEDRNGRVLDVNPAVGRMLGYSRQELIDMHVWDLTPDSPETIRNHIAEVLNGFEDTHEVVNIRKDGSTCDLVLKETAIQLPDGSDGVLVVSHDITERKRAEAALRVKIDQLGAVSDAMTAFLDSGNWQEASATILRSALDQTGSQYGFVGVVAAGSTLRILAHDGFEWDDVIGRELYEQALRDYDRVGYLEFTSFENLFGKVITSGRAVVSNDPSNDPRSAGRPPGHPPLRHFLGVPILKGSEVVGMIGVANRPGGYMGTEQEGIEILCRAAGVLYDSYRRQQYEDALEQKRKQAEQALRHSEEHYRVAAESNRRLLHEVNHRVRNNLASLLSLISLIRKNVDQVEDFAAAIESRLKAMSQVHSLLVEAGWQDIHLCTLVNSLIASARETAAHQIEVIVDGPPTPISPRQAVPLAMSLTELFTNSCKHGAHRSATGKVHIAWQTTRRDGNAWVQLAWRESGGPEVKSPVTPSLGTELIEGFVNFELGGRCQLRYPPSGADHVIEFTLDQTHRADPPVQADKAPAVNRLGI